MEEINLQEFNKELAEYIQELEMLVIKQREIKSRIAELKQLIGNEMTDCMLEKYHTEQIEVTRKSSYKITVLRENSEIVYKLLEQNGYKCSSYSSEKRAKIIGKMLENDGELPDWLLGRIHVDEVNNVDVKLKK